MVTSPEVRPSVDGYKVLGSHYCEEPEPDARPPVPLIGRRSAMLKFIGSTVGIIFLIGLAVVVGLFMLIF